MTEEKQTIKKEDTNPKTDDSKQVVKKEDNKGDKSESKIAIILLRGLVGIKKDIKDTLHLLKLRKKHVCVIVNNTASIQGMIKKVKDYVTYGEIDDLTLKELIQKRGKKGKEFFELPPPKGGFERKGLKKSFNQSGAIGNRGKKINDLIKRML